MIIFSIKFDWDNSIFFLKVIFGVHSKENINFSLLYQWFSFQTIFKGINYFYNFHLFMRNNNEIIDISNNNLVFLVNYPVVKLLLMVTLLFKNCFEQIKTVLTFLLDTINSLVLFQTYSRLFPSNTIPSGISMKMSACKSDWWKAGKNSIDRIGSLCVLAISSSDIKLILLTNGSYV